MSDHWTQLGRAEAWAAAAKELERDHPRAARVAWRHASRGYDAYCEAYAAHMPASRWDYDYGREAADAHARATDRTPLDRDDAALPDWIADALAGRLDDARAHAPSDPADELGRAVRRAIGT
jgi:hypothetical protein